MKISGSYDFRLDEIADVGGIRVTQVSNMGMDANNPNAFSITLAVKRSDYRRLDRLYSPAESIAASARHGEDYGHEYARHRYRAAFLRCRARRILRHDHESHDLSSAKT